MNQLRIATIVLIFMVSVIGCVQPPDYPDEPAIFYNSINKTVIAQGNTNAPSDTLAITFDFEDGDGDIGSDGDSLDVFLTDSRDGFVNKFKLPVIPDQGIGNGISGSVTLYVPNKPFNICCTYPDGAQACLPNPNFPTDTFSFSIQMRDRKGRFSNKIQTETITILCDWPNNLWKTNYPPQF